MTYRPRTAPARFFEGAPEIVRKNVLDFIGPHSDTPCPYDVILRPDPAPFHSIEIVGLDFDAHGARGCHFFLKAHEARKYREKHRRTRRLAWADLPEPTRRAIVTYLES